MTEKRIYFPLNGVRVCVDSRENTLKGRAYSPHNAEPLVFSGVEELLLSLDEVFNAAGYPQAFQDLRSFSEKAEGNRYRGIPESVLAAEEIVNKRGEMATYDVIVESRRNSSWQGIVRNADGGDSVSYNGELELIGCLFK